MSKLILTIEVNGDTLKVEGVPDFDGKKEKLTQDEELIVLMADYLYQGLACALHAAKERAEKEEKESAEEYEPITPEVH